MFNNLLSEEDIPKTGQLILTSEKNTYGAAMALWREGKEFVNEFKMGTHDFIRLQVQFYTRVTLKIKDQDLHLMTMSSINSKTFFKFLRILDLENLIHIFPMLERRLRCDFTIFLCAYLHNKNILEYV